MKPVQQDLMCALLQTLLDKELITLNIYNKSRKLILETLDWPEFFCYAEDDGKEKLDGSA